MIRDLIAAGWLRCTVTIPVATASDPPARGAMSQGSRKWQISTDLEIAGLIDPDRTFRKVEACAVAITQRVCETHQLTGITGEDK